MQNLCPCGSGLSGPACCAPIIAGTKDAVTAEELMRSRYVAFTQANGDYLMRSHSSATRSVKDRKSIEKWAKSVSWMGLFVLQTRSGMADDKTGYVEFRAVYMEKGMLQQIHEVSLFERENGKWVYVSGEQS
jgi:SEC-C motif-containing protein